MQEGMLKAANEILQEKVPIVSQSNLTHKLPSDLVPFMVEADGMNVTLHCR
jgi:hypothetical protein